jgi:hypothetical protein
VHSRYLRTVSDLPWHGISVELEVLARRFFYDEASCERKIFCERLEEVAARARKTVMLEEALVAIGLELGGRAGARLALELGIVAARDALLRRIKAVPLPEVGKVRVLGVDDFAFKKGTTYGTTLVNRTPAQRIPCVGGCSCKCGKRHRSLQPFCSPWVILPVDKTLRRAACYRQRKSCASSPWWTSWSHYRTRR